MTFNDASILIGLLALAVPLAIHLLGRERAREIILPTAQFADSASQASRGRFLLRRWGLLALRLGVVFCLVTALAGPAMNCGMRIADCGLNGNNNGSGKQAAPAESPALLPFNPQSAIHNPQLSVLVVDAAEDEDARVRSADLVAATFAGDAAESAKVTRLAAAEVDGHAIEAADVIFWVGGRAPARADVLAAVTARGGVVWVPATGHAPEAALAAAIGMKVGQPQPAAAGVTMDPGGYVSDLLTAFEGGTSGDLGAPVFQQRLAIEAAGGAGVVRFRDGAAAIVSRPVATRRNVALAFGPAPMWGDLAGRAEFVVLTHSLAEAVGPSGEALVSNSDRNVAGTPDAQQPPSKVSASVGGDTGGPALAARGDSAVARPIDLTPWLALALAAVLAAEGLVAARQSAGMVPEPRA
jgi:hypothetical protein